MENIVVKVYVNAQVGGYNLAVHEATLTLGVNAIPSINLTCAPTVGENMGILGVNVQKPTISEFAEIYKKLSVKAEGLSETGFVKIRIEDDYRSDEIELNWILSGVGMSSVGATKAPYLSVILQHPICKLTKVGSIYESPKTEMAIKINQMTKGASNFLDVVQQAYSAVRDHVEYWPTPQGFAQQYRMRLGVGEFDPKKYLEWNPIPGPGEQGIFMAVRDAKPAKPRLAQAIGRFVVPSTSGSSTWDMLISASGPLLLSITQDEDHNYTKDKLVIEPTKPWKSFSVLLEEERCHWTEIPGQDPYKISAVMCRKLGPYSDLVNLGLLKNGNASQNGKMDSEVMYKPPPIPVNDADGRVMKVSVPMIFDSAYRRDAPRGGTITSANIDMLATRANHFNSALEAYCQAVYEITAASMIHANANMVLGFRDSNGNLILPGLTCCFMTKNEVLYYGYIRNVVHHMSTEGRCGTMISMSYVRPKEDYEVKERTAIEADAPNAAYSG